MKSKAEEQLEHIDSIEFRTTFKTEFARGPGRGDKCHLSKLDETQPDWRDYQTTLNGKVGRLCDFSLKSWTTPLGFLPQIPKIALK